MLKQQQETQLALLHTVEKYTSMKNCPVIVQLENRSFERVNSIAS